MPRKHGPHPVLKPRFTTFWNEDAPSSHPNDCYCWRCTDDREAGQEQIDQLRIEVDQDILEEELIRTQGEFLFLLETRR